MIRRERESTGEEERERREAREGGREVEEAESGDFSEVLSALNPPFPPLLLLLLYGVLRHLRCEMRRLQLLFVVLAELLVCGFGRFMRGFCCDPKKMKK